MDQAQERVSGIDLGRFIKRQRAFRNLTQAQVGEGSGKQQGQITKLENGKIATVPLADIPLYAAGLGLSRTAVLLALKHHSVEDAKPLVTMRDEEALTLAEAFISYESPFAKEALRQALHYADQLEKIYQASK